jgi:FixJ family two-component response regulator
MPRSRDTIDTGLGLGGCAQNDQSKPTVFVVDDDVSVRESLEGLISTEGWKPVILSSAQEFLAYPRLDTPSCLVLDLSLPDINGLDLQRRIIAGGFRMPIIFITGYGDIPTTVQAMKAGASEFLTKPLSDVALLSAIRQALAASRAASLIESEFKALEEDYQSLTPREREVMKLVVLGHLNKRVGFELGISEITVKAHRGQVMRKMKARSFAELVNMARKLGLEQESDR